MAAAGLVRVTARSQARHRAIVEWEREVRMGRVWRGLTPLKGASGSRFGEGGVRGWSLSRVWAMSTIRTAARIGCHASAGLRL